MPSSKFIIALILVTCLLAALAMPVLAVDYNPGVNVGQYVKYGNFAVTGPGFESFSDLQYETIEVTNVAGKEVTLLSLGQYKNDTATPGNGTSSVWNIEAGTQDGSAKTQGPIIAANLNSGDAIPPPNTFFVNATEIRSYIGVTRTVNVLSVALLTPDYNSTLNYVYDKESGLLLESSSETIVPSQSESTVSTFSYSVIETNVFASAPANNVVLEYVVIAVVLIAIVAFVVAVLSRRR